MRQIVTVRKSDKMLRNRDKVLRNRKPNAPKKNKLAFSKGVYSSSIGQNFVSDGQISP